MTGKSLSVVFEVSGWVQGNMYKNDPLKGELNVFVGTGFDVTGQYAILTWEITMTGGFNGVMDFELKFDEEKSKYTDFFVEKFGFGFKDSLELYGGIGVSSLASVGLYGAGSIGAYTTLYPATHVDSLVLAGECGFKVKLFSRALFSFAIVSGSHEFVKDDKKALLNIYDQGYLSEFR